MLPIELHAHISASREEIFDLISDLGVRPAWNDHYQSNYRLVNPQSRGAGAGARYLMDAPMWKCWVGTSVVEADRPRRIVERTAGGRGGKSAGGIEWEITPMGRGLTRVALTIWSETGTPRERFKEKLGFRRWVRRGAKGSLDRLRVILEERPDRPLARASVAAFETLKAPRFGMHPQRSASAPRG
jgi:uncharacterized protein YndB with AHSA1/START domain